MTARPPAPRDHLGRFMSLECPEPDCDGHLVLGTDRFGERCWHCNGLVDPGVTTQELQACPFEHPNGSPRHDH